MLGAAEAQNAQKLIHEGEVNSDLEHGRVILLPPLIRVGAKKYQTRSVCMSGSHPPKTAEEAMKVLESLGHPKVREMNAKNGAPNNQFGVKLGDIRTIAKSIKTNHELGLELWGSGNVEAMFLATLIVKPKAIPEDELERMVAEATYSWLADWLMSYVVKQHPAKEALRERWLKSSDPMLARAGWSLTTERVVKNPEGLDTGALLDRIEHEMGSAPAPTQWTMNFCLGEIGIRFAEHRERAINIGETLGLYRDYPVHKGCTSPFVPIWVREMVARQV
jgi:3-methyladenine DNA glycosylase AlkD